MPVVGFVLVAAGFAIAFGGPVAGGITVGAGLLGLGSLALSPRFRARVDAEQAAEAAAAWREQVLRRLPPEDRRRYLALEQRCAALEAGSNPDRAVEALRVEALRKLCWTQLQLFDARARLLPLASAPEVRQRLGRVDGELDRVEAQVERLAVAQVLEADPAELARRVDAVVTTLDQTGAWLAEEVPSAAPRGKGS